jgi:hypothetical protein
VLVMDLYPESWADFVTAAGTSGADVYLPEGAVWDMNEIAPDGISGLVLQCANLYGRGAEIRNLRGNSQYAPIINLNTANVDNLKLTNFTAGFQPFGVPRNGFGSITQCTFSGLLGAGVQSFAQFADFRRCAFNIEYQSSSWIRFIYDSGSLTSCRIRITAASAAEVDLNRTPYLSFSGCEVQLFSPNAAAIGLTKVFTNSTLRGNMQGCTSFQSGTNATDKQGSIYNSESFPAGVTSSTITAVTDAQMRDADYLRGIGFMIGVS